jgi:hypothetical protein
MKLAKVTSNEPTERIAIGMKASAHANLKAYQEFYKATYGEEIALNQLVETMLVDYMKDDKDFQKALSQNSKTAKPPAANAAGSANAGAVSKAE